MRKIKVFLIAICSGIVVFAILLYMAAQIFNFIFTDEIIKNFPEAPVDETGIVLAEYPYSLTSVKISPDGKLMAVGGLGIVWIWDLPNRKKIKPLIMRIAIPVRDIAWSFDNQQLAIALKGERVEIWQTKDWIRTRSTDSPLPLYPQPTEFNDSNLLTYTPDNTLIAAFVSKDFNLYLWQVEDNKIIKNLGHSAGSIAFSQDGSLIVAVDNKNNSDSSETVTLAVWNSTDGSSVWNKSLKDQRGLYDCYMIGKCKKIAINPNNEIIAFSTAYGTVQMWDIKQDKLIYTSEAYKGVVGGNIYFSTDGETFATVSDLTSTDGLAGDDFVKLWNMKDGGIIKKLKGWPSDLSFSPDKKTLVSLVASTIVVWKYK